MLPPPLPRSRLLPHIPPTLAHPQVDKLAADDPDAESAVDSLLEANLLGLPKEDLDLGYWDWSGLLLLLPVGQVWWKGGEKARMGVRDWSGLLLLPVGQVWWKGERGRGWGLGAEASICMGKASPPRHQETERKGKKATNRYAPRLGSSLRRATVIPTERLAWLLQERPPQYQHRFVCIPWQRLRLRIPHTC